MDNSIQNQNNENLDMFDITKSIDKIRLLEFIKQNSPVSIWDISKRLNINRNSLYFILRNFQYAGLITSKIRMKSHRPTRIIYYKKKRGEYENKRRA